MAPPLTAVTVSVSPFGSLSWPTVPGVTSPLTEPSSTTLKLSSTAMGSPLTPVMVKVTVAESTPPLLSEIV